MCHRPLLSSRLAPLALSRQRALAKSSLVPNPGTLFQSAALIVHGQASPLREYRPSTAMHLWQHVIFARIVSRSDDESGTAESHNRVEDRNASDTMQNVPTCLPDCEGLAGDRPVSPAPTTFRPVEVSLVPDGIGLDLRR
jgi:hypothetical protein